MAPPFFSDLGRAARDVLNNGYTIDMFRCNFLVVNRNDTELKIGGTHFFSSNMAIATMDTSTTIAIKPNYLIYLIQTLDSRRVTSVAATIEELLPGLSITAGSELDRQKHLIYRSVLCEYKNDFVAFNLLSEFKSLKPVINASAVVAYNNLMAGINVQYDTNEKVVQSTKLAFSFSDKFFTFTTTIDSKKVFGCSIFQKVSNQMDLSMGVCITPDKKTSLAIGTKVLVDKDVKLQAKFNSKHQLCLSTCVKFKYGISLTLSSLVECLWFERGRHKFGISLKFEP